MTNMHDLIHAANLAATKNDHWLFLVTLLLFGLAVFIAFRWLVGKFEKQSEQSRVDQQQFSTTILNVTADQNKTAKELAVVLDRCACALEDNNHHLRLCRDNHAKEH